MAGKDGNIPVWLTIGFAVGLGFAWLYLREDRPAPAVTTRVAASPTAGSAGPDSPVDAGTLASVERFFQRWGGYAVWTDEVAEFAVWNLRRHGYTDFYEVRHVRGRYYFRTIPRLSRPIIDHGVRSRIPLQFTETQDMRDEFYRTHPDYDASKEPVVDLPPRRPNPRLGQRLPERTTGVTPESTPDSAITPPEPTILPVDLTPGAGY
jgi:hypothetical protein